jgi:hypothetical protein
MPAKGRQQTAQSTAAPSTSKYVNKDGSKFITVPKANSSADSIETSSAMAQPRTSTNGQEPQPSQDPNGTATVVNRKKQKRREKQRQQEQARLEEASIQPSNANPQKGSQQKPPAEPYPDTIADSDDDSLYANSGSPPNGYPPLQAGSSPKTSKKKSKNKSSAFRPDSPILPGKPQKKIWNTSGPEERESIKEFWLQLGEEERRALVKIEKDAVLKKMKEQQKHSCSCTVCGRKRVAIEEELEVLYDAYYEELEQYANHQPGDSPLPLSTSRFGPMNNLHPPNRVPSSLNGRQPIRPRLVEHLDDDDDEVEYSDDDPEDDDYLSEDDVEEIQRNPHANDFFTFGQSLTVKGNSQSPFRHRILTNFLCRRNTHRCRRFVEE